MEIQANAVARLQKEASALASKAAKLVTDLIDNLGFSQVETRAILLGHTNGLAKPSANAYLNLAQWATNHWGRLRAGAEAHEKSVASNSQVRITLQATRRSLSGGTSLLHIEDWDTFAEGNYSPIDRTGLRPTEAEQKRLEMERQASEAVAMLIRSARTNDTRLKDALKGKLNELEDKLSDLQRNLRAAFDEWDANSPTPVTAKLQTLADTGLPETKNAATAVLTNLQAFNSDFQMVTGIVQAVRQFKDTLRQRESGDPLDLLLGAGGLVATGQGIVEQLRKLAAQIDSWPDRVKTIEANVPTVAAALAEDKAKLLPQAVKDSLASLRRGFPQELAALEVVWTMVGGAVSSAEAADALSGAEDKLIPHTLDNLVDGRLDLKYAGLALGDVVSVKLRATNAVTGQVIENITYQHEVGLMGLHGKPAVHLIFARSVSGSGEAAKWKPNVAAAVEWHYTIREPRTKGQKTWNWLYPGAGIHAASLDQGSDSFELGAGVNVSFWDGLLTGGFGYNFSGNKDPKYVFVGVNLLSAFSHAKNQFSVK